jgi:Fe-S cluster assembly protein SufD
MPANSTTMDSPSAEAPISSDQSRVWAEAGARLMSGAAGEPVPVWFAERQAAARSEYARLAAPQRKDEHWRFADLKKFDLAEAVPGEPFTGSDVTAAVVRSVGQPHPAAKIVLGNDRLLHADTAAADGIVVLPLMEALRVHEALIREHFMAQSAGLGGEKFYALHAAALRGGVFVYVPPGLEVDRPIELHQWIGGINASTYPHTLVVAGRGSKVTVVDYFQSLGSEPGFACGVTDLAAGDGASITYVNCQRWSRKVRALHFVSTTAGRDASVRSIFLHLGAAWARTESFCLASGAGSRSEMFSLAVAEGTQEIDCRTRQIHGQPHTFSDLLFKNVLFDQARTIFSGLILVEDGAHYTDAYQTCRNLLLSDEAEANALPGLEINADQVKCSHGSTTGPLDGEQIYYLRSRGIREADARQLLAFGFCRDVIERLGDTELEHALSSMVEEKFRRMRKA